MAYQYQSIILVLFLLFSKQASYANPGADKKWAGSSSNTLRHIFLKFSDACANSNVSLLTYNSR